MENKFRLPQSKLFSENIWEVISVRKPLPDHHLYPRDRHTKALKSCGVALEWAQNFLQHSFGPLHKQLSKQWNQLLSLAVLFMLSIIIGCSVADSLASF